MPHFDHIAIVGVSLAGLRAAEALREKGFTGRLTLLGAESLRPYDRPPLSKEILTGGRQPEQIALERGEGLAALGVELRLGERALRLDGAARSIETDRGERIAFDGLVIATGARPRRLPLGHDLEGVHTLRTLDDALAIRAALERGARVAVIGAGFIGAEVAASCRERGLEVDLVEALPLPLGHLLGEDVGRCLAEAHAERGVRLHLGAGVEALEGPGRVEALRLVGGRRIETDLVVVGIGVAPNVDWLEGSGLALENGVRCDTTCATSLPGVVAAGDVASWENPLYGERMRIEHWTHATEMARAAAANLLAGPQAAEPFATVPYFWSDQYDLKIQSVGRLVGADRQEIVRGSLAERRFIKFYGRKGRLRGALGFGEARRVLKLRRALREGIDWDAAVALAQE